MEKGKRGLTSFPMMILSVLYAAVHITRRLQIEKVVTTSGTSGSFLVCDYTSAMTIVSTFWLQKLHSSTALAVRDTCASSVYDISSRYVTNIAAYQFEIIVTDISEVMRIANVSFIVISAGRTGRICESPLDNCLQQPCGGLRSCTSTGNTFSCGACIKGYDTPSEATAVRGACVNLNECQRKTHNCPANISVCFDTRGSFTCPCMTGYSGKGGSDCKGMLNSQFMTWCLIQCL